MKENLLFYLGLSLIILHEMDALRKKEWRIIPGLSLMKDNLAQAVFSIAHIPLFIWLFWALNKNCNLDKIIFWFDIFLIVHLLLHLLYFRHRENAFKGFASWAIITGAGLTGLLDVIVRYI